jgi:hypothetical protein
MYFAPSTFKVFHFTHCQSIQSTSRGVPNGATFHILSIFKCIFTIGVPKKSDLFFKDYKQQLWIFFYLTLL